MKNVYFMFLFKVILLMLFVLFCILLNDGFLCVLSSVFYAVFRDNNDFDGFETLISREMVHFMCTL